MSPAPRDPRSKAVARFPDRVYTHDEVQLAKALIDNGYRHRLKAVGSVGFKDRTRRALRLVRTAGCYDFLRTYIGMIREIEGLSQLREAEAAIWANAYTVEDSLSAACFFIQKAWQMKNYVEGTMYYGHQGEMAAADEQVRFLKELTRRSRDPKIREECRARIRVWEESKFL